MRNVLLSERKGYGGWLQLVGILIPQTCTTIIIKMINTIKMIKMTKMLKMIKMMFTRWAIDASFRPPPTQHRCFLYRSNVIVTFTIATMIMITLLPTQHRCFLYRSNVIATFIVNIFVIIILAIVTMIVITLSFLSIGSVDSVENYLVNVYGTASILKSRRAKKL